MVTKLYLRNNKMIPRKIYRGDADPKDIRNLRYSSSRGQYYTNLIKGGIGQKIFSEPFMNLVNTHILSKFEISHFLSFTESKNSAMRYGLNLMSDDVNVIEACSIPYYEDNYKWDFALLTLSIDFLTFNKEVFPGVYELSYTPQLLEFSRHGPYRVILIDVSKALGGMNSESYATALEYSKYDSEWLVLPATIKEFNGGKSEFSGILDGACFESPEYFIIDKEQYDLNNTLDYGI
ncbi:hypothetical protein [Sphingobacterium sp. UBA7631]|nr:hypothetical protein [Sphingobacterium sp. UBA7631]